MSGLDRIGVKVELGVPAAAGEVPAVGNALAILNEVATALERLASTGEATTIDLRAMPLAPGDHERLLRILGEGEVEASVDALGPTEVRETAVHGVWWVTHYNAGDEVVAEFIDVTRMPEILMTDPEDVHDGLRELRGRLEAEQAGKPEGGTDDGG